MLMDCYLVFIQMLHFDLTRSVSEMMRIFAKTASAKLQCHSVDGS